MSQVKLGVLVSLEEGPDVALSKVHDLGFSTCQVVCWNEELLTEAVAERLVTAADRNKVEITTLWTGYPGYKRWNFIEGPISIGLVPPETRSMRLQVLKKGSDFARRAGIQSVTTHVGFIPENMSDPLYSGLLIALKELVRYCEANGQGFWFETGQETPITLLRTIHDVGMSNVGVNLDPANLLLYGKANPVDALDIIGEYVRGVHAKDGEYPTDGQKLGVEKPLGKGRVNFPALLSKLLALGYDGSLTIEREIKGPQQIADIKSGKIYLEEVLQSLAPGRGQESISPRALSD
jgi:sugar phosphate isomerase/epimerase